MRRIQRERDNNFDHTRKLLEETEKNREQLIRSELSIATTFSELADTEYRLGNRKRAHKIIADAKKAIEQVNKRVAESSLNGNRREEVRGQIQDLTGKLDDLERKVA